MFSPFKYKKCFMQSLIKKMLAHFCRVVEFMFYYTGQSAVTGVCHISANITEKKWVS